MSAQIIDGKKLAKKIRDDLRKELKELGHKPGLAVIMAGDNSASEIYVRSKQKACEKMGFHFQKILLPADAKLGDVLEKINLLNNDPKIDGYIVQLPLPENVDGRLVMESIFPDKDADGFHPMNIGNMLTGNYNLVPATPKGILTMIESTGEPIQGKHAVVIGRSNIVGKPIANLLLNKNATVTMCHSKTRNLKEITQQADILVCAIGREEFVTGDMVKEGAIVIDVGINRVDGKIVGDVEFETVNEKASWISPVPGGVGPMTIASLLQNTVACMKLHRKLF